MGCSGRARKERTVGLAPGRSGTVGDQIVIGGLGCGLPDRRARNERTARLASGWYGTVGGKIVSGGLRWPQCVRRPVMAMDWSPNIDRWTVLIKQSFRAGQGILGRTLWSVGDDVRVDRKTQASQSVQSAGLFIFSCLSFQKDEWRAGLLSFLDFLFKRDLLVWIVPHFWSVAFVV